MTTPHHADLEKILFAVNLGGLRRFLVGKVRALKRSKVVRICGSFHVLLPDPTLLHTDSLAPSSVVMIDHVRMYN